MGQRAEGERGRRRWDREQREREVGGGEVGQRAEGERGGGGGTESRGRERYEEVGQRAEGERGRRRWDREQREREVGGGGTENRGRER